jgi:hypothetical protein
VAQAAVYPFLSVLAAFFAGLLRGSLCATLRAGALYLGEEPYLA